MKTERNIFIAFILNLGFSIFELFGGIFTNSVAIISDSVHDMGDSISIGLSYFLEKKSKKDPDNNYTYGYIRYSVLGGLITTLILMVGSVLVICGAITRIIHPVDINYSGMIIFAIFGVIINFIAAYFTSRGDSINQRSVNLHMLEDVLGWVVVLIGAIIMNFTDIKLIDSIMSICVSLFILFHALKNFKKVLDLFLEKTPKEVSIDNLKDNLLKIDGVEDIHHIHVWSIDGYNNYATLHVVSDSKDIKKNIRKKLKDFKISHVTIEVESKDEKCLDKNCDVNAESHHHHH